MYKASPSPTYTEVGPEVLYGFADYLTSEALQYRDNPFQLRAGGMSHWYLDLRRGLSDSRATQTAGQLIVAKAQLLGLNWDVVAGAGVGGCAPLFGTAFAADSRWSQINDNQEERTLADTNYPYGMHPKILTGDKVLVVDDTLTSGSSLITSIKMARGVRQEGDREYIQEGEQGIVEDVFVIADRSHGAATEALKAMNVQVHALFELDEQHGLVPVGM